MFSRGGDGPERVVYSDTNGSVSAPLLVKCKRQLGTAQT